MPMKIEPISFAEWEAEAVKRFGVSPRGWKFKCPSCGHVQSMQDFRDLDVDVNLAYVNCIGRYDGKHGHVEMGRKPGPCNYTSGGLFNINPVAVTHPTSGEALHVFAFAE